MFDFQFLLVFINVQNNGFNCDIFIYAHNVLGRFNFIISQCPPSPNPLLFANGSSYMLLSCQLCLSIPQMTEMGYLFSQVWLILLNKIIYLWVHPFSAKGTITFSFMAK